MKEYAAAQGYKWYYAVDANNILADEFGANRTPECFLFNADGKHVYHGAIDDNPGDASSVNRKHLKVAMDEMTAGKDVSVKESRSMGCQIKRKNKLFIKQIFVSPDLIGGFFLIFVWIILETESKQKIRSLHTNSLTPDPLGIKLPLMNSRTIINKALILSVFVIAGYLLARSFYYGSFIGIVLALVGIVAWSMFLYKLSKMQAESDTEEAPESY
jgi:hypothetical protein